MKNIIGGLFSAAILFAASLQTQADSVVQVTADIAGLTPVDAASLPGTGTFWVVQPGTRGQLSSMPFLPPGDSSVPIYHTESLDNLHKIS